MHVYMIAHMCKHNSMLLLFSLSHCQLVYDIQDGGGCFHLIAVNADIMSKEEREKYQIMGAELPPT